MNAEKKRIILYGKSVIMGTVGASLQSYPELEVIPFGPHLAEAQDLKALDPDVILFDLQSCCPESALSLSVQRPELVLIGIDPDSDRLLVWSGKHAHALSTRDLVSVIQNNLPS